MFGALAYLPTYLQMVTGANATQAGLLMIPMMAALLLTSIVSGQIVSRTGRYKWLPMAGMVLVADSLVLLSTMTPGAGRLDHLRLPGDHGPRPRHEHADPHPDRAELVPGQRGRHRDRVEQLLPPDRRLARLGDRRQPVRRQARPSCSTERMPAGGSAADGGQQLAHPGRRPGPARTGSRDVIVGAYNDALTPVFLYMVPLVIVGLDPAGVRQGEAAGHHDRARHPAGVPGDRRRQLGAARRPPGPGGRRWSGVAAQRFSVAVIHHTRHARHRNSCVLASIYRCLPHTPQRCSTPWRRSSARSIAPDRKPGWSR